MTKFAAGQTWKKPTPFVREYLVINEGLGTRTVPAWRLGCNVINVGPQRKEIDSDGEGYEVRTIHAFVEMAGEQNRILYRSHYLTPDGEKFGGSELQMTTPSAFSAWINDTAGCRDRDSRMVAEMAA